MNERDDGGPAFPVNEHFDERRGEVTQYANAGMSLRDHFAGRALTVWVQAHIDQSVDDLSKPDIARECYSYADAMLKERAK